jgi:hypothetical protein
MTLKCYLLTLLKIHRPDCEPCKALEKGGIEMRERLEELNSEPAGIFGEVVGPFALTHGQTIGNPSVSLPQQGKRAG